MTLGLVLALEKPEPGVMDRPPRLPTRPLLDGFTVWRTFYVTIILVTAMLGNEQWTLSYGGSLAEVRHLLATSYDFLMGLDSVTGDTCS